MIHNIYWIIYKLRKEEKYKRIIKQINSLVNNSDDLISKCSTVIAILHHKIDYFFWTDFYFLKEGKLLVGPYQGALACVELDHNKGVCWASINQKKVIIVPDVHQFHGYIACDSRSKSEIVIPLYNKTNQIIGVFDVDNKENNSFDEVDAEYLKIICNIISS